MKHRMVLVSVAALCVVTALAFAGPTGTAGGKSKGKAGGPAALQGKQAPAFDLKTLDGQTVSLDSLKGKVVVLDFWATWCPPCRESLPHLNSMATDTEMAQKGLKVIAMNVKENPDKVKPFMEQNKYTFTVAMDSDGAAAQAYMVGGIPQTVVIGHDGLVKKVFVGFGGEESAKQLHEVVEAALKAKAAAAEAPSNQPSRG